jgi:NADH:ubiquinone oxidoreductase subunit D
MHDVLRLIITLDGEDVIDCELILGYLHRRNYHDTCVSLNFVYLHRRNNGQLPSFSS